MATPGFLPKSVQFALLSKTEQIISLTVFDLTGATVDISTGYTARAYYSSQSFADNLTRQQLTGTWSYGSDGVLSLDLAASDVAAIPCSETLPLQFEISNDSFATLSICGYGTIGIQQVIH